MGSWKAQRNSKNCKKFNPGHKLIFWSIYLELVAFPCYNAVMLRTMLRCSNQEKRVLNYARTVNAAMF